MEDNTKRQQPSQNLIRQQNAQTPPQKPEISNELKNSKWNKLSLFSAVLSIIAFLIYIFYILPEVFGIHEFDFAGLLFSYFASIYLFGIPFVLAFVSFIQSSKNKEKGKMISVLVLITLISPVILFLIFIALALFEITFGLSEW